MMKQVLLYMILMGAVLLSNTPANASAVCSLPDDGPAYVAGEVLVKFKRGVGPQAKAKVLSVPGEETRLRALTGRWSVVSVPEGGTVKALRELAQDPAVAYAQPNYIYRLHGVRSAAAAAVPDDPWYGAQWNFDMINIEDAWEESTGAGVVVAVIDTGVNPNGKDGFGGRLLDGYNAIFDVERFWEDDHGHGTHVAGTIAQETGNGIGCAGIAFDARILPVKALNRHGIGDSAAMIAGIRWAVDNGADIINMSFSAIWLKDEELALREAAIEYAYEQGVVMIAGSGNLNAYRSFGPDMGHPANSEKVIAVGSVNVYAEIAGTSDGSPDLDLVAPGGDGAFGIYQETFARFFRIGRIAVGWGSYASAGTSMACSHVSGTAALLKSIHPDWGPEEIKEALVGTVTDLGPEGKDDYYGYGLLDAAAAVRY